MTDLTEQWKKGELPSGWYWVDYYSVDGPVMLEYIPQHNGFCYEEKELVQAVLAPVPSYEEWQAKLEENAQLKELLEWCRDELFEIYSNEVSHPEDVPIIKKLNEVLK